MAIPLPLYPLLAILVALPLSYYSQTRPFFTKSGFTGRRGAYRSCHLDRPSVRRVSSPLNQLKPSYMLSSVRASTSGVRASTSGVRTSSSSGVSTSSSPNLFTGIGLLGEWQQMSDAYVLRPKVPAKSIVLFVGGAFVGAAPQQWYRYLMEELAKDGHVVVTTPYQLDFDYNKICLELSNTHNSIVQSLREEYGVELPIVGIGHSCGSLLQTMLSSNITGSESFERVANILISFNNKPIKDAIPAFEQLVTPAAIRLTSPSSSAEGPILRSALGSIQSGLIDAQRLANTGLMPPIYENEILPFVKQALSPLDQIPGLFERIADGVSEFSPSTPDIQQSAKETYRASNTLLVKFKEDSIDETEIISSVLESKGSQVATLRGTHVTPCIQDVLFETPLDLFTPSFVKAVREETRRTLLSETKALAFKVLDFLDGVLPMSPSPTDTEPSEPMVRGKEQVINGQVIVPLNVSGDSDFTPFL